MNIIVFLLTASVFGDLTWDYHRNGSDWNDKPWETNQCYSQQESPIDLTYDIDADKIWSKEKDNFNKVFNDVENVLIDYKDHAT